MVYLKTANAIWTYSLVPVRSFLTQAGGEGRGDLSLWLFLPPNWLLMVD